MKKTLIAVLIFGLFTGHFANADGQKTYENWCETCHALHANMPGTDRIREMYGEERVDLTNSPFVTEQSIRLLVREGRGMMPPFRRTEINDSELNTLVQYLVNQNAEN